MTEQRLKIPPPELFAKCYEDAERHLECGFPLKFAISCAIRTAYTAGAGLPLEPIATAEQVLEELGRLIQLIPSQGALAMSEPIRCALERLERLQNSQNQSQQ